MTPNDVAEIENYYATTGMDLHLDILTLCAALRTAWAEIDRLKIELRQAQAASEEGNELKA